MRNRRIKICDCQTQPIENCEYTKQDLDRALLFRFYCTRPPKPESSAQQNPHRIQESAKHRSKSVGRRNAVSSVECCLERACPINLPGHATENQNRADRRWHVRGRRPCPGVC